MLVSGSFDVFMRPARKPACQIPRNPDRKGGFELSRAHVLSPNAIGGRPPKDTTTKSRHLLIESTLFPDGVHVGKCESATRRKAKAQAKGTENAPTNQVNPQCPVWPGQLT